ncbi:carnitine dehydratase [Bradyrhizobium forestalis]|uniref:Carnitine dehydratase n=1 Tax=Bradyrhizobium forestalis TaxID=1419263 RepID=A0A2M8QYJ7_9BRAD|nr:CoA transferase [Bradyrhizobium forestalis]PJG50650.1 carnitine dehydratase [Bradyrhizobium forestalis]
MQSSNLPLHGVKVIDFGQYIAGPAAAMVLGDLGATVVHIDPPSGPLWASPANAALHRNKLIVRINLKTAEGLAQAQALIAEADIVIENFRPGVLARLGIDFSALRRMQPELVTVSIPGFASDDALRREWRAFESVVAASAGVFTDMGRTRVLMGKIPYFSALPLASAYGTMIAASATVLALQARERTGIGDQIEVPLICALMEGLTYNSQLIENLPRRYTNYRSDEIKRRLAASLPMDMPYHSVQDLQDPFYRTGGYRCKDGRMFAIVCAGHKVHTRRCLQALGIYDSLIAEGLVEEGDPYLSIREWKSDHLLSVYPLPRHWHDKILARMKAAFLTRTSAEWERIFQEHRIAGTRQNSLQEWMQHEHALSAGLMVTVDDSEYGPMTQPGPMTWLQESGEAMLNPAPRRSVAFGEALATLSSIPSQRPARGTARKLSGWLDGVRVLDMANVIAGPHTAFYLARFGAEVIKLDPVFPAYHPGFNLFMATVNMAGKQSTLVDITSAGGREVFEKLVKSADVIVWNATERDAKRRGLDRESVGALNPNAIYCQVDCFGGARRGPRSDDIGYDDVAQAVSGIMVRFGGSPETPEEHAHTGTIDALGAYSLALGVAAALYQKSKGGRAGRPRTSLAALSGLLQIPYCYDYSGRGPFDEPAGPDARGFNALAQLYVAGCGHSIMLNGLESDLPSLARVDGLQGLCEIPARDRAMFLAAAIGKLSAEDWVSKLKAADIGVAICKNISDIRAENIRPADAKPGIDRGSFSFSRYTDHPSGYTVVQLDPYAVRPAVAKIYALSPAEKYGASTRKVLRSLGYTETDIDELVAAGEISESWSREYLPS